MLHDHFSNSIRVRLDSPYFEIVKSQVSCFFPKNYRGYISFSEIPKKILSNGSVGLSGLSGLTCGT